jgi:hypothetical protein
MRVPNMPAIRARLDRFNPGLVSTNRAGASGSYQHYSVHSYGAPAGGNRNYGPLIAEAMRCIALDFMSDVSWATIEPAVRRMVALGSWLYDIEIGDGRYVLDGDGGHHQWQLLCLLFGMIATGRGGQMAQLTAQLPNNQLSQHFRVTAAQQARLVPHSSATEPHTYRLRTISAVTGNDITIPGKQSGDPFHLNFFGLQCRRANGTIIGTVTTDASSQDATSFTITLTTAGTLAPGEQVYFTEPYTITPDDPAWVLTSPVDFNTFNPSPAAVYMDINCCAAEVMLTHALGVFNETIFGALEAMTVRRANGINGFPQPFGRYGETAGSRDFVEDFWGAHRQTLDVGTITVVAINLSQSPGAYGVRQQLQSTVVPKETLTAETDIFVGASADRSTVEVWPITNANTPAALARLNAGIVTLSKMVHYWHSQGLLAKVPATEKLRQVLTDWTLSGSSRRWMMQDDALSGAGGRPVEIGDGAARNMAHDRAILAVAETYGRPALILEDRFNAADLNYLQEYTKNFAPFMLGQRQNGSAFTLGSPNPDSTLPQFVDDCIYDVTAPDLDSKGRGALSRRTKWTYAYGRPVNQARIDGTQAFYLDPRVQQFAGPRTIQPILHVHQDNADHATADHVWGQNYSLLAFAFAIAKYLDIRATPGGASVEVPQLSATWGPGGTYFELAVTNAPPGAFLSTIAAQEGIPDPSPLRDDTQPFMDLQIQRPGVAYANRQAVMRQGSAQAADLKGVVSNPEPLKLRFTPDVAFTNATIMHLSQPEETSPARPSGEPQWETGALSFRWTPVLVVPGLRDSTALYKFPGLPLPRGSWQYEDPPPAPPGDPQLLGVTTNGGTAITAAESSSFTVPAGNGTLFVFLSYNSTITTGNENATHGTIGAAARAQGTGTAMTRLSPLNTRSSSAVAQAYAIQNPGAGNYTFQYGLSGNSARRLRMTVVWVPDAALPPDQALQVGLGGSSSPISFTPTPTVSTSLWLYMTTRNNASLGAFTVTGAAVLSQGDGGNSGSSNTSWGCLAWEKPASLAQRNVSKSWTGSTAARCGFALEVTR